ncbi:MAG: ATP-binding cassette domain-containing protein [Thermodesulfobacteriota bacterium]
MSEPIIRLVGVTKRFGEQVVLDRVDLDIPAGKTTVIAGGSGQGKSVTLKLILGLLKPDAGQILVDGQDIGRLGRRQLATVRMLFGVLFQGGALFDSMTVYDNVALPLRERTRLPEEEIRSRVMETLKVLDLAGHEHKFPAQLSGGMRKRVGLCRALQLQPRIMLFDEPTTGLDPRTSREIYQLFYRTQLQYGYTSVIVSHDIPKVFTLADRIVVLNRGVIQTFDSPEAIQTSQVPEIKQFVATTMGHVYSSREVEG